MPKPKPDLMGKNFSTATLPFEQPVAQLEKTIQEMEKLLEQGWVIKYYEGGVKVWKAID